MKKIFWILLTVLLLTASLMAVAHAAKYAGNISVNNTGEAATNVATVMTLAPQQLIDNFGLDTNFADVAILDSGGADVPFMPANNSTVPWVIWVPSIGSSVTQNLNLYVANVTDSTVYYFPGSSGMTTPDADSMEPSDNFTYEVSGYIDTDNGTNKYILRKDAAAGDIPVMAVYISPTVSGNITASISDNSSAYIDPANFVDPDTQWGSEGSVYDNNLGTYATESSVASKGWSSYLELTHASCNLNGTQYAIGGANTDFNQVNIWSYYGGGWHNEFTGAITVWGNWNTVSFTAEIESVTELRFRFYNNHASLAKDLYFLESDFSEVTYTPYTVSAANLDSNEYTVTAALNSPFFGLGIDSGTDILPSSNGLVLNAPMWQTELEASPFTTIDAYEYSCTVTGATWISSQGYSFDGNDYITYTGADWRSTDSAGTILVWYKTTTAPQQSLFASSDEALATKALTFNTSSGKLEIYQANAGSPDQVQGGTNSADGNWHLGGVVSSGTAYSLYLDAAPEALTVIGGANYGDWFADTTARDNFTIGAWKRTGVVNYLQSGTVVGDVAIYSRALSQAEIQRYFNATKSKYTSGDIYIYSTLASIPDNDNDWVSFENNVMPYVDYQKFWVGGNLVQNVDWEYSATFQDATDYNNDATPTFREATSDADVTANLVSLQPITQAVSTELPSSSWPSMLTSAPTQPSTTYTEEERPGFFLEPAIHELLAFGNVPDSFFWTNFCFLIILLAGMIAYRIHPSLILKAIIMGAIMIWFAAPGLNVYGQYVVLYFIFYCFGVIVISRSYGL